MQLSHPGHSRSSNFLSLRSPSHGPAVLLNATALQRRGCLKITRRHLDVRLPQEPVIQRVPENR